MSLARRQGQETGGHRHRGYLLPLSDEVAPLVGRAAGTPVTVRIPRVDALSLATRTWQDETAVLRAVKDVLPGVPDCLVAGDGFALHSHVDGPSLSALCGGEGKPVDARYVEALTGVLADLTQVRRGALPALPSHWPGNHSDSQGFLRTMAVAAHQQIVHPNWPAFGGLFAALGIRYDAMLRLAERVPAMSRRPFGLLHGDLHRENVIVVQDDDVTRVVLIDWQLASYGDPLYDLANHVVRTRYPLHQRQEVVDAWAAAVQRVRPPAGNNLHRDLRHHLAFEEARSVFSEVMRAARQLQGSTDQETLDEATGQVRRALEAAAPPLGLGSVPDEQEIERILFRWRAARAGGRALHAEVSDWVPDQRFPEHTAFPRRAVDAALRAEGAAPAGRVFKGTGHLNTVVRVPGVDFPVVVRRKVANVRRRERGFLSEHAVLRAIEESGAAVRAPRFLALGTSYREEPFAVHTYVGPPDMDQPPSHPVRGLLPHEADGLVDQLLALTEVGYERLDPAAGVGCFYTWLSEQLVQLVAELPRGSQQVARLLGLPDALRLKEILARHQVTRRRPGLLHGDLNPWNLVRRSDRKAPLTIIDWEMAVVGDPLYDLVRHMHLTPTRPEIRERMFGRWERLLPAEHTADWRRDWGVYRWIEIVRSAYVDLDRLVTGASLDAPNVRRAVDSYAMTLAAATASLGLPVRSTPDLARAFA
ncbi:phosphotransferase family protein [Streptomyces sp. NPDC020489]|uniref:phosphotransferase family protein n=1 Tax=Streptomyces sp. NPDC020489 TaxID=3365077 RepID=UPI00378A6CBC